MIVGHGADVVGQQHRAELADQNRELVASAWNSSSRARSSCAPFSFQSSSM
ncbi:hypothetical protein ACFV14_37120 [Streptomyces zaomyceticus]|uniref:hypothetical protein n=1 Tax=Streptomyces zaomyceticus TaxID=68286 RepID=UPI0036B415CC